VSDEPRQLPVLDYSTLPKTPRPYRVLLLIGMIEWVLILVISPIVFDRDALKPAFFAMSLHCVFSALIIESRRHRLTGGDRVFLALGPVILFPPLLALYSMLL
jgi:hypothetical protein